MSMFEELTNLFPVQKTLKFKLLPDKITTKNLKKDNPMSSDASSADEITHVKRIADEYHKYFIDVCLAGLTFNNFIRDNVNLLEAWVKLYKEVKKASDKEYRNTLMSGFVSASNSLRALLVEQFTKNPSYEEIFKKELVTKLIPSCPIICDEDKEYVKDFKTSLLGKYNASRKNMYSPKADATAIANRLINENLPRYIDNIQAISKILDSAIREIIIEEISKAFESELGNVALSEFFSINNYPKCLTQKGIDKYNSIIRGKVHEQGNHVEGINSIVKKYNDTIKDRKLRLPLLKSLYKSILGDGNIESFRLPDYLNDSEMASDILSMYHDVEEVVFGNPEYIEYNIKQLFKNIQKFNSTGIFVNASTIELISTRLLGRYDLITKGLQTNKVYKKGRKEYSLFEINEAINTCEIEYGDSNIKATMSIFDYFKNLGLKTNQNGECLEPDIITEIKDSYSKAKTVLNRCCQKEGNIRNKEEYVAKIKNLLESIKRIERFLKVFIVEGDIEKDDVFYLNLDYIYEVIHRISSVFVRTKNRLTRKPYSSFKFQLSFDYVNIMKGWSDVDGHCLLLEKDGKQYLAIINNWSEYKIYTETFPLFAVDGDGYKFTFGQGGRMGQNIERLMVIDGQTCLKAKDLDQLYEQFVPNNINRLREKLRSTNELTKEELITYIDFYQQRVKEFYSKYDFSKLKAPSEYNSFEEFVGEVEEYAYKMDKQPISWSVINELNKRGDIYLFQIYCKDFSDKSKGKPNLQTIYWRQLFSDINLQNNKTRITGKGTLYYRPASIKKDIVVHKKNKPMDNKRHINGKLTTTLPYNVTKDKRYTEEHFEIHIPIMLNYSTSEKPDINAIVQEQIKCGNIKHVIGIDRGERNLLYVTVVDMKGNIKEQTSLNIVDVEFKNEDGSIAKYGADYHQWMIDKGADRKAKMRDWQSQTNIKDLKAGYISQAVHKIAQLVIKYNAIISLEALTQGFMGTRHKIDNQVYQKFETMLINKLNYLVFKDTKCSEYGSVDKPIQLTDMSMSTNHQNGIIFFIEPWKTSKIDPTTGFTNFMSIRYETNKDTVKFVKTFKSIMYNSNKGWFEFVIEEKHKRSVPTEWIICSYGKRIEFFRNEEKNNEPDYREIDLTSSFMNLFCSKGFDLDKDLVMQISRVNESVFYKQLIHLIKLMMQLRNSNKTIDELRSPVMNGNGVFFNSFEASANQPNDADANGAFNIGRKGIMLIERILSSSEYLKDKDLFISNEEWIEYARLHPAL